MNFESNYSQNSSLVFLLYNFLFWNYFIKVHLQTGMDSFLLSSMQQGDDPLLVQQGIVCVWNQCISLTTRFGFKPQVPKWSL